MNTGTWLLLSAICWLAGYFDMKLIEPDPAVKLVYVPKWMFILLLGAPKYKNIPATVQTVRGVYLQSMGITMAVYGVLLDQRLVEDVELSGLIGFAASILVAILISYWLNLRRPYYWENDTKGHEE